MFTFALNSKEKIIILITPPFGLAVPTKEIIRKTIEYYTMDEILRNVEPKKCLIHLVNVPKIQIEWKKHAEGLAKCKVIVYGEWGNFAEFSKRIDVIN